MESTWKTRDLPVLDAIVLHFVGDDPFAQGIPEVKTFTDITGLDAREVLHAVRASLQPT